MPSFVSHTVYLKKFWDGNKYPSNFFYDGFLGALLPDIRYLTKQNREITHNVDKIDQELNYDQLLSKIFKTSDLLIKIDDISDEKLFYFKIGFSFHTVFDQWWGKQIYFHSTFEKFDLCLKFIDDILLMDEFNKLKLSADLTLRYKIDFLNLDKKLIEKWYNFVFWYIKKQPSVENIKEILTVSKLFDSKMSQEIANEVNKTFNEQEIINKLQQMYLFFKWNDIKNVYLKSK